MKEETPVKKKNKKGVAGVLAAVAAGILKLILKAGEKAHEDGSKWVVSLLYILVVLALVGAVCWIIVRVRAHSSGGASALSASLRRNYPGGSYRKQTPKAFRMQSAARVCAPVERETEQWKSLYEAGLITREEYRERLGRG